VKLGSLSSKTVGTCVFTLTTAKALIRRRACYAMQGPEEEAEVDKLVSDVNEMVGRSNCGCTAGSCRAEVNTTARVCDARVERVWR